MSPDFTSIDQPFSNQISIDGKTYLYFGGTAYLGIPQNREFLELYLKGIKKYGLNNGTSRSNNIQLGIYNDAEQVAAGRFKSESALIISSGYLAAQLAVKTLSQKGKVLYAPATHPALWLKNQESDSRSFTAWALQTLQLINTSDEKNWVLISNSMNNLFPEIYDFGFLKQIDQDKKLTLIVDDSHGIGVNNFGRSAYDLLPQQENIERIVVASMAKALGVDAGLILASKEMINKLKNTNEFNGASPSAAAGAYAFIHAAEIYQKEWEKLQQNISFLVDHLDSRWNFAPNFPAFLIHDSEIDQKLLKQNILISSFPYPTQNSKPINRIVLSSWHQEADILKLASAIA
ncbi:aminotransferase class I/II-fold pyridoxal phosphate-dependent enzyme [Pedobacter fastidiosus]|uniref:Aminotransferase class I/II-fold pyridoxal phosphate-dependent enzyme n=1 Tax=Pedobacter fastidiosus TaxID=2765361 RepID=A0ABR7KPS2_9SPHI|nr:aminotransferase class I/II-fold pyridoxal phosphate-dependent enzyme [Pedobacter fastidiosus]MBC6110088.1 aminotransferase class I/II-fold pyridoxal phosphate-dependent enzyme [Pedobacter fastidiosus]